jgi:hypothetical protein
MRRLIRLNSLLMGLLLFIGLTSYALAAPTTEPKTAKTPEAEITVTGKLIRVMAIGGETTGWAVDLDKPRQLGGKSLTRLTVDPAGHPLAAFEHRRVEIAGVLEKRTGIERQDYWVIVLKKIRGYTN